MWISGYRDLDFLSPGTSGEGYSANLPPHFMGMPEIRVNVLTRPGAMATFAPIEVGEMVVPVTFIYHGTILTQQQGFQQLFKRLDLFNRIPGQLRAQLNDGTKLVTLALIRVSGFASFDEDDVNCKRVDFVSVAGWQAQTATTTTGTF